MDGLALAMGGITFAQRVRVAQVAQTQRLPTVGLFRSLPEAGGLMSYGPDLRDVYRRVAGYVDRILKGARPADLPVGAARAVRAGREPEDRPGALGLTMPSAVLARAEEVLR